jgi:nucleotide-binding universal stress UspA family protein
MYQRIVVGTDGSDRAGTAVDHAARLADLSGAELHLVLGCGSPVVAAPYVPDIAGIDPNSTVQACTVQLEEIAEPLRSGGRHVAVHVRTTSGHAALCDVAAEVDADVIVVGNRGMAGARRFLGSVPNSVAHQAPCSVLIVSTN